MSLKNMGLLDIIVMVLVVVAVVSRFTKFKLPKDPRDRATRRADLDSLRQRPLVRDDAPEVVDITPVAEAKNVTSSANPAVRKQTAKDLQAQAKNLTGMAKLKVLEPGFNEAVFLDGAKAAYEYFYVSWNAKDEEGLDNLTAPALFDRLMTRLHDDRVWSEVVVEKVVMASLADVRVHGKTAIVDVDFEAVHREGGNAPKTVRSRWVLAKPLSSEDPNWELQDMTTKVDA